MVVRRFEEGMMKIKSKCDGASQDGQSGGSQSRFHIAVLDRQPSRERLTGTAIALIDMMIMRLLRLPEQNGQTENIAAEAQTFAVPHHSSQVRLIGSSRKMGKAQKAFVVRLERGGSPIFDAGAHELWRGNG